MLNETQTTAVTAHARALNAEWDARHDDYMKAPSGSDAETEAHRLLVVAREAYRTYCQMTDAEKWEVVEDDRTRAEREFDALRADTLANDPYAGTPESTIVESTPAEEVTIVEQPLAHTLSESLDRIAGKPYTDSEDRVTIQQAGVHLVELQLGNDQKAEALSNAQDTIRTQGERIQSLQSAQISGDDYRLTEFWNEAMALADRHGYCDQYDTLAEALGGPARSKDYEVRHELTVTVNVTAYSSQTARSDDDLVDWSDLYDISDLRDNLRDAIANGSYEIESETIEGWEEA